MILFFLLQAYLGDLDAPLHKERSHNHRVREEFPKILYPLNSLYVMFWIMACFDVRIPRTLLYLVSYLLAAVASHILKLLQISLLCSIRVSPLIFVIFFTFMLAKFTSRRLLRVLAAAPPHLTAPFTLMSSARPVVILLL